MGYRYIGAKTQIVDAVLSSIQRIAPAGARIADLMCGTGVVSASLRKAGYEVIANDVMTYSYHHARVQLLLNSPPTFSRARQFVTENAKRWINKQLFELTGYEEMIQALNSLPGTKGYFYREFSPSGKPRCGAPPRNYFVPENAARIDAIRGAIRKMRECAQITSLEHSLLLHDLVMAANDVANIAGTYGHYLAKTVERSTLPIELRATVIPNWNDHRNHKVYRQYAEDLARRLSCDLCYIDPPYMKRQYAANYHLLETLAREDEPEAVGLSGLRPWRDQYSDFCTKTRIRAAFGKIISGSRCPHFLISYSEDGLLAVGELVELLEKHGKVVVHTVTNRRFKSNNSQLPSHITEYLIHLSKH